MGASLPPPSIDASAYVRAADLPAAISQMSPVTSVNGKTGDVVTATIPGFFKVQDGATPLPDPTQNAGRYANVSDLGGVAANGGNGTGLVYSNGICWSRFRSQTATVQAMPLTSVVSVTALKMSSLIQLTGANISGTTKLNITGACQGDVFRVIFPAGLLSLLGSLGISINSAPPVPIPAIAGSTTGTWADYSLSGTNVVKIAGGSL